MLNRRLKGPIGWIVLSFAFVGLLAYGAGRDTGPRTDDERVQAIAERIACPVCDGESVAVSRNPASDGIKESIRNYVRDGDLDDDQIIATIVAVRGNQELLVPIASGVQALAWALPATAFVIALVGLTLAFRRWRANAATIGEPTDADYQLVAQARADRPHDTRDEGGVS